MGAVQIVQTISAHALALSDVAAQLVARALGAPACAVWELLPPGEVLLLRAATGTDRALAGKLAVAVDVSSPEGYALRAGASVIIDDLERDPRFAGSRERAHGFASAASAIVPGDDRPFGVLAVAHRAPRAFSPDDLRFLESSAALLGEAMRLAGRARDGRELAHRIVSLGRDEARPINAHSPSTRAGVRFTPRERQVLALIREGLTNAAIALRLGVSVTTVRTHVRGIIEKLGVNSKLQAIVRASEQGMLHD